MSLRIKPEEMKKVFLEKLKAHKATDEAIAEECAAIMVENSINGVYSHGVNRFPRMISYIDKGYIKPEPCGECPYCKKHKKVKLLKSEDIYDA